MKKMIKTLFSSDFSLTASFFIYSFIRVFFPLKNKIFSLSHSHTLFISLSHSHTPTHSFSFPPSHIQSHTLFLSLSHSHTHFSSLPLTLTHTHSQKHIDHARVPSVQISCFSEPCSPLTRPTSVTPSTTTSGKWTSPLLTRRRQTFFWEDDKGCRIHRVFHKRWFSWNFGS